MCKSHLNGGIWHIAWTTFCKHIFGGNFHLLFGKGFMTYMWHLHSMNAYLVVFTFSLACYDAYIYPSIYLSIYRSFSFFLSLSLSLSLSCSIKFISFVWFRSNLNYSVWFSFRNLKKKKQLVSKDDKAKKRLARKERKAKKDPNKPKRAPSAFFVFL